MPMPRFSARWTVAMPPCPRRSYTAYGPKTSNGWLTWGAYRGPPEPAAPSDEIWIVRHGFGEELSNCGEVPRAAAVASMRSITRRGRAMSADRAALCYGGVSCCGGAGALLMRRAMLVALAAGCAVRASSPAPPSAAAPFAAARWVPERPAYVLASSSVAGAQRAARDAFDLIAAVTGHAAGDAVRASVALLGVDALDADPLAAIGVDIAGGWTMFGGDPAAPGALDPTLVVHLAAPAQMAAFLDRLRARGLATRSVIADGAEVVTAALPAGIAVSWAIEADWMWLHVAPPGPDDGARWFAASHGRHGAGWTG